MLGYVNTVVMSEVAYGYIRAVTGLSPFELKRMFNRGLRPSFFLFVLNFKIFRAVLLMEKRERYIAAALVIVFLAVAGYFIIHQSADGGKIKIHADPEFSALLAESNTVVLRLYFPYTDAAGPGTAATYAMQVLVFSGKTVILQLVEGNRCIRNVYVPTPNEENVVETNEMVLSRDECVAESALLPTIEMRQAPEDSIYQTPTVTTVEGRPEHIPLMVRYVITRVYPNADEIVKYIGSMVSSAITRR